MALSLILCKAMGVWSKEADEREKMSVGWRIDYQVDGGVNHQDGNYMRKSKVKEEPD